MAQVLSRRDRVRAATLEEIKQTARRLLIERGTDALTLRAIAREMGMTAPGLYRYFGSREELVKHVIADMFIELTSDLQTAIAAASAAAAGQGEVPQLTAKMIAACREFRRWALGHKAEYTLLFGTPLLSTEDCEDIVDECGRRFAATFFALFVELWQRNPFPVLAADRIDAGLRAQLERYRDRLGAGLTGAELPAGTMLTFLRCWGRLYGAVTLEAFDHLKFALDDASPMFEYTLSELADSMGLTYEPGPGVPL